MKVTALRRAGWTTLFVVLYGVCYLMLRMSGGIVRHENRGEPGGNEIRARVSQFHGLIPELDSLESGKVGVLNVLFFPMRKIEEWGRDWIGGA